VSGKARQQIKLPCFWQKDNALIMPAFGSLTGLKRIKPGKGDKVFLVSEGRIIAI
jgi:metallophosphoesterase superfamily enzyme